MSATGLYVVILEVLEPVTVVLGKKDRKEYVIEPGWHVYTGSGGANVWKRVARHMSRNKPVGWNIDLLTCDARVRVASAVVFPAAAHDRECELNGRVEKVVGGVAPAKEFGSHGCRAKCPAHLWRCSEAVDASVLARGLRFGKAVVIDARHPTTDTMPANSCS